MAQSKFGLRGMALAIRSMSLVFLFSIPALALEPAEQRGLTFVTANCNRCHAVDRVSPSPLGIAPPFRTLHTNYPVENLAEALAEGISVHHTGERPMPEITLTPEQIDDLLAHLETLE